MGYLTLDEMTEELALNLQGKNIDPVRLTRWVNFGLVNLATFKELEELREVVDFPIVSGTNVYAKPADLLGVKTLEVNGRKVVKTDRLLSNLDDEMTGPPTTWYRRGDEITVWPMPDDDYDGTLWYQKIPERLVDRADVSPFNAGWDVAIVMLATHHGFLALRQNEEANQWLGRALGYISSRVTEKDVEADTPRGGGVNIAWELDDIRDNPPHYEE